MSSGEEDEGSIQDNLEALEDTNFYFDFSAWSSFRGSLSTENGKVLRRRSAVAEEEINTAVTVNGDGAGTSRDLAATAARATAISLELSDAERRDNAAWRLRLMVGPVFRQDYTPEKWERREMDAIVDFLKLKNPNQHPHSLAIVSESNTHFAKDVIENQIIRTRNATSSIFFPEPSAPHSVLLKRGPVLLRGEERELMVFTHGFLVSRVELDTLVQLLLDTNPEGVEADDLTPDQWSKRFRDIDISNTGSLDRWDIRDFFIGTGMVLSSASLDGIMKRFGSDSDGTISLNEFKSIFYEVHQTSGARPNGFSWKTLGAKLKRNHKKARISRKLDAAFCMADIEKIEIIGLCQRLGTECCRQHTGIDSIFPVEICQGNKNIISADSQWENSTLAVFTKGETEPMLLTCAKPGHAGAWMEAFRTCIKSLKSNVQEEDLEQSHQGLIHGLIEKKKTKKDRLSRAQFAASAIQWADGDDTDEDEW